MKIAINQPHYIPWLNYYERIIEADVFVYLDHVQFEKNSLINRNYIVHQKTKQKLLLTIPIRTKGNFNSLYINTLTPCELKNWRKVHIQTISSFLLKNSKNPALLKCIIDIITDFPKHKPFVDLIYNIDNCILEYLNSDTVLVKSSSLNLSHTKSDLILEICHKLNAKKYISGPFGRDYLDFESFKKSNIALSFSDESTFKTSLIPNDQNASVLCDL